MNPYHDQKACEGAATLEVGRFEECLACQRRVLWEYIDHPFFGFESACPLQQQAGKNARDAERAVTPAASEAK